MTSLRLAATDLDGTLLDERGELGAYTEQVLGRLQERGVHVVVVTARPLRWMTTLWPRIGGGLGIVSNGAITYDVARRRVVESHSIPPDVGLALAAAIRAAAPGTAFGLEALGGYRREPGYLEMHLAPPDVRVGELADLWDDGVVKVLAQHLTMAPALFRSRVTEAVGEQATATWTTDHLMEISAVGVTKGGALAALCGQLGISAEEVVAFGDMPNDIPMLAWAGTSYAVANAHESVRAVVDHLAPANADQGVARTLERLFGL